MQRVLVALIVLGLACFFGCGDKREKKETEAQMRERILKEEASKKRTRKPSVAKSGRKAPEPGPTAIERLSAAFTLCEAIAATKPLMTDERNKVSAGAILLARWMAQAGVSLRELELVAETSLGKVMKDPAEERGRVLCGKGPIAQIQAERTPWGKVYHGGIGFGRYGTDWVRFVALGSTRELVKGSKARFCGVVIGTNSFANLIGGVTNAPQLVGMFDLSENTKLPSCAAFCARAKKSNKDYPIDACLANCKKKKAKKPIRGAGARHCLARKRLRSFAQCVNKYSETVDRMSAWVRAQQKTGQKAGAALKDAWRMGFCSFAAPGMLATPAHKKPRKRP